MARREYTGKDIEQIMLLAQSVISLNTLIKRGDGEEETELGDFIEDPGPTPEEEAMMANRHDVLMNYLQKYLSPRERKVIILRFGLENDRPMTLGDVGREYNITRERVRQIEAKAIRKLKVAFVKNKITREDI